VKPFLLLSHRRVDLAADDEYAAMLRFSGLDESGLRRIRMEQTSIADLRAGDWAGIILGGGPFTVSANSKSDVERRVQAELLTLLDEVVDRDLPFLGACYGIGVLGTHQGALVDGTYAEKVGGVTVSLTDEGRADPLFGQLPDSFDAYGGHKEAVTTVPPHMTVLASTPACPVHAFRVGQNVYATQFHPELDDSGLDTRIEVYRHAGYFEPHEADAIRDAARAFDVSHPGTVLRAFVERYTG
jgi:GMP synthase (glutamine-hydrolysing)